MHILKQLAFVLLCLPVAATALHAADRPSPVDPRIKATFDTVDQALGRGATPPGQEASPAPARETAQPPARHSDERADEEKTAAPVAAAEPSPFGKRFGLIIGIDRYRHLAPLSNAVSDARAVDLVLREKYGFHTRLILDGTADRESIMRALNDLRRELAEEDSLLIFYSGHGEYHVQTETSYWLPVDADRDDTTRWLDTRGIADQLKLIAARQILVVADSCFAGTLTRSGGTDLSGASARSSYLRRVGEKPSRVLIASGGSEPVIDAGGRSGHSVFTDSFITALEHPFAPVFTAEELVTRQLREAVAGRAEQIPEFKVIRNSGHEGGDFVFVRR